jgi:phosphohistidine phosphatase
MSDSGSGAESGSDDRREPGPIQQAEAIPFRRREGSLEFCLITSLKRRRWIFPKGIIDPGETGVETALKEAREEAGLDGRIVGAALGSYRYAKWGTVLDVDVYLMEVARSDEDWAERELRERRWVAPGRARTMLARGEHRELLERAISRLER